MTDAPTDRDREEPLAAFEASTVADYRPAPGFNTAIRLTTPFNRRKAVDEGDQ